MADWRSIITAILILVTFIGAGVCAMYWFGVTVKVMLFLARRPTARVGLKLCRASAPVEPVVVIIPAHNESRVIEPLVKSLRAQTYAHASFLLALDRCTDDTLEKARAAIDGDPRFQIHEVTHCPPDWAGKVHALYSAVELLKSRGELPGALLFADADTRFDPEVIAATLAILRDQKLELLSLLSTLSTEKWFEKVVQTATTMEIARMFPLSEDVVMDDRRAFANGQFMLFDAAAYESFGGHKAVKDAILEDLALARLMAKEKRPVQVLLADQLIRCHMYDTFAAYKNGWKRIYIECVDWKVSRLTRYGWSMLMTGCILPLWGIGLVLTGLVAERAGIAPEFARVLESIGIRAPVTLLAIGIGTACTVSYAFALILIYRLAGAPIVWAVTHPIGSLLTCGILLDAARDVKNRVPIRWGGREYTREPR